MSEKRSVDSILRDLESLAEEKAVLNPELWEEAAWNLNLLLAEEENRWATLKGELAQMRVDELAKGSTATKARMLIEATPQYVEYLKLDSKIERVKEQIRIAKKRGEKFR